MSDDEAVAFVIQKGKEGYCNGKENKRAWKIFRRVV
jgi:hypothetical protein